MFTWQISKNLNSCSKSQMRINNCTDALHKCFVNTFLAAGADYITFTALSIFCLSDPFPISRSWCLGFNHPHLFYSPFLSPLLQKQLWIITVSSSLLFSYGLYLPWRLDKRSSYRGGRRIVLPRRIALVHLYIAKQYFEILEAYTSEYILCKIFHLKWFIIKVIE